MKLEDEVNKKQTGAGAGVPGNQDGTATTAVTATATATLTTDETDAFIKEQERLAKLDPAASTNSNPSSLMTAEEKDDLTKQQEKLAATTTTTTSTSANANALTTEQKDEIIKEQERVARLDSVGLQFVLDDSTKNNHREGNEEQELQDNNRMDGKATSSKDMDAFMTEEQRTARLANLDDKDKDAILKQQERMARLDSVGLQFVLDESNYDNNNNNDGAGDDDQDTRRMMDGEAGASKDEDEGLAIMKANADSTDRKPAARQSSRNSTRSSTRSSTNSSRRRPDLPNQLERTDSGDMELEKIIVRRSRTELDDDGDIPGLAAMAPATADESYANQDGKNISPPLPTRLTRDEQGPPTAQPGAFTAAPGVRAARVNPLRFSALTNSNMISVGVGQTEDPDEEEGFPVDSSNLEVTTTITGGPPREHMGLAQAREVSESDLHIQGEAEEYAAPGKEEVMAIQQQHTKKLFVKLSCLLLAISGIVLGILYATNVFDSEKSGSTPIEIATPVPTGAPSMSPTLAPTSFVLPLPIDTQLAILNDPGSTQAQAYRWTQDDVLLESYSEQRLVQRFALMTFFYSTNIDNSWINSQGWGSHDLHECEWFGKLPSADDITCSPDQNYVQLLMTKNGLQGTIPPEIGLLTFLNTLNLATNELTGSIPTDVGKLSSTLSKLILDVNKLTGMVPSELGELVQLQNLFVHTNDISHTIPTEIGQLTNLEDLSWNRCQTTGNIPTELGLLTALTAMLLNANYLSGPIPSELGLLTDLELILSLYYNELTGTFPVELCQLSKLEVLYVDYNFALTGTLPTELGLMTSLTNLAAYVNQFSGTIPSELGSLGESLEWLEIYGNQFSGTIPSELGKLTKLKSIGIEDNLLSASIPLEIFQNLQNLTALYASNNAFLTGTIDSSIGMWSNLDELYLHSSGISGWLPSEIGLLPELLEVMLSDTLLSGPLPPELALLPVLRNLTLQNTLLSGSIPPDLCSVSHLEFNCSSILCGCYCMCLASENQTESIFNDSSTMPLSSTNLTR